MAQGLIVAPTNPEEYIPILEGRLEILRDLAPSPENDTRIDLVLRLLDEAKSETADRRHMFESLFNLENDCLN